MAICSASNPGRSSEISVLLSHFVKVYNKGMSGEKERKVSPNKMSSKYHVANEIETDNDTIFEFQVMLLDLSIRLV
jgi:hypothetical protein